MTRSGKLKEASPVDRPQKIKYQNIVSEVSGYNDVREAACSSSRLHDECTITGINENRETASPCGWPKFFLSCYFPVYSVISLYIVRIWVCIS